MVVRCFLYFLSIFCFFLFNFNELFVIKVVTTGKSKTEVEKFGLRAVFFELFVDQNRNLLKADISLQTLLNNCFEFNSSLYGGIKRKFTHFKIRQFIRSFVLPRLNTVLSLDSDYSGLKIFNSAVKLLSYSENCPDPSTRLRA